MRCVDRGPWPRDAGNRAKRFTSYQRAKADLLERLGEYCSYCERTGDLHVEHVVSRYHAPGLEREWTNFLLGCSNCNGTKGNDNDSREGYLWPDQDDTQAAFEYLPDGIVEVRADLPEPERTKAQGLFALVGLGRRPARDPRASDMRWRKRREAWRHAEIAKRRVQEGSDIDLVIDLAKAIGFWSVWMTVFADCPHVCGRLEQSFPGTRDPGQPK